MEKKVEATNSAAANGRLLELLAGPWTRSAG